MFTTVCEITTHVISILFLPPSLSLDTYILIFAVIFGADGKLVIIVCLSRANNGISSYRGCKVAASTREEKDREKERSTGGVKKVTCLRLRKVGDPYIPGDRRARYVYVWATGPVGRSSENCAPVPPRGFGKSQPGGMRQRGTQWTARFDRRQYFDNAPTIDWRMGCRGYRRVRYRRGSPLPRGNARGPRVMGCPVEGKTVSRVAGRMKSNRGESTANDNERMNERTRRVGGGMMVAILLSEIHKVSSSIRDAIWRMSPANCTSGPVRYT